MEKLTQQNFERFDEIFHGHLAFILRVMRRESKNLKQWNMYNPKDAAEYVSGIVDVDKEKLQMLTELVIV